MKKTIICWLVMVSSVCMCLSVHATTNVPVKKLSPDMEAVQTDIEGYRGIVKETMDSGGYTYVLVDIGTRLIWAASSRFRVEVGETVIVPAGLPMENFHSKTLNRDFDLIYFVSSIKKESELGGEGSVPHPSPVQSGTPPAELSVERVAGGKTVQEIYAGKKDLEGKFITIRAKVVKFTPNIMGKNWIHLQDGTGSEGANDLTVTSTDTVAVGDTVLAKGTLAIDKDFGSGYRYDIILEGAEVRVE